MPGHSCALAERSASCGDAGRRAGTGGPRPLERGARRVAGKRANRFRAASSFPAIRVDPTPPPAHQCAWPLSSTRIRTRRDTERPASAEAAAGPPKRERRRKRAYEVRPFSRLAAAGRGRPVPARRTSRPGHSPRFRRPGKVVPARVEVADSFDVNCFSSPSVASRPNPAFGNLRTEARSISAGSRHALGNSMLRSSLENHWPAFTDDEPRPSTATLGLS